MSLLDYYFEQQLLYESKYGENTIVFIMKGSFYEAYESEHCGKASTVAKMLNFAYTRVNKKLPLSDFNPGMTGVPTCSFKKHLKLLIEHMYTIVVIDQESDNPSSRKVAQIYSPGTYTEATVSESTCICSVYFDYTGSDLAIGICFVDLNIGSVKVYEVLQGLYSKKLEEVFRLVEMFSPKEVVCIYNVMSHKQQFHPIVQSTTRMIHHVLLDSTNAGIEYQNTQFNTVFHCESLLTPIEHLDLEMLHVARIALSMLLDFCVEHCISEVQKLKAPEIYNDALSLILHNNSVYQLGILNNTKDKSLFDILNHTNTTMGKRLLKHQVLNPYNNVEAIEAVYTDVEKVLLYFDRYEQSLKMIYDIEKLFRRVTLNQIQPFELVHLYTSLVSICTIQSIPDGIVFEHNTLVCKEHLESTFNLDHCDVNFDSLPISALSKQIAELDEYAVNISKVETKVERIKTAISKLISPDKSVPLDFIKLEGTSKTGYGLFTTVSRGKMLQKNQPKEKEYTCIFDKSKCKIANSNIDSLLHKLANLQEALKPLILHYYGEAVKEFAQHCGHHFNAIVKYIAYVDTIKSRAACVKKFNYSKPQLKTGSSSFVEVHGLKHAIVEQLDNATNYVPTNVKLDEDERGILLYGVNGAGKSCYSKAVGLAIVMAQSGHYVPAEQCILCPFSRLYTRISDVDNIYKGQSSFFVEMSELKSIVHYADERCIVLGDEVCKGTEDISALAIVSTTVKWLVDKRAKFIFATHLNKLPFTKYIKDNPHILIKHIAVECDTKKEVITYTREIKDGIGEILYGLEIANVVIQNKDFTKMANKCRNEITNAKTSVVEKKRSKYNKDVFVDVCQLHGCNSTEELESHHIVFQSSKPSNAHGKGNLVVLCRKHHNDVHNGSLVVKGWIQRSNGRELEYYLNK